MLLFNKIKGRVVFVERNFYAAAIKFNFGLCTCLNIHHVQVTKHSMDNPILVVKNSTGAIKWGLL